MGLDGSSQCDRRESLDADALGRNPENPQPGNAENDKTKNIPAISFQKGGESRSRNGDTRDKPRDAATGSPQQVEKKVLFCEPTSSTQNAPPEKANDTDAKVRARALVLPPPPGGILCKGGSSSSEGAPQFSGVHPSTSSGGGNPQQAVRPASSNVKGRGFPIQQPTYPENFLPTAAVPQVPHNLMGVEAEPEGRPDLVRMRRYSNIPLNGEHTAVQDPSSTMGWPMQESTNAPPFHCSHGSGLRIQRLRLQRMRENELLMEVGGLHAEVPAMHLNHDMLRQENHNSRAFPSVGFPE